MINPFPLRLTISRITAALGLLGALAVGSGCGAAAEDGSAVQENTHNCGAAGQRCCRNSVCDTGNICSGNRCVECGDAGETCCEGGTCNGSNTCNASNTCEAPPCGGASQGCCAGGTCNEGHVCTTNDESGLCFRCGDPGEYCCSGGTCNGSNYCQNSICQSPSCGGPWQPCCADSYNHCTSGYSCRAGTCVPNSPVPIYCGGLGQPCCQDGICSPPNTCAAGVCVRPVCLSGSCYP